MQEEKINNLKDFIINLKYNYTHKGGLEDTMTYENTADLISDSGAPIYGSSSVILYCNDLLLPDFDRKLTFLTREIEDEIHNNIQNIPELLNSVERLYGDCFDSKEKYIPQKQFSTPYQGATINKSEMIIEVIPDQDEIVLFYSLEIFAQLRIYNKDITFKQIVMSYNLNASIEDYIECIRVTLKSLIETLDKKLNRYSKLPTSTIKEVTQGHEKIKWNKTSTMMGYLFYMLHEENIIELPSDSFGKLRSTETAKWLVDNFTFPKEKNNTVKIDSLRKRLNENNADTMNANDKNSIDTILDKFESLVSRIDKYIE